ncbi:mRNA export factor Gle1 isoform X2 [Eurosta solidaginis]|uniref:mRNA export factor Gle1 isoform X2 n=1 Tax=Eurosta solidaginis TaxID=178769 RepID=UPI0035314BC0
MSEGSVELERIIEGDITKAHEITLQHAIEISPFVKERTIGPDLPERKDQTNDESVELKLNDTPKTPQQKTAQQKSKTTKEPITPTKLIIPVLKTSPSLDFELVNATVMLRDAEDKRKKHVRQQMHDIQEKQIRVLRSNAVRQREQQGKFVEQLIAEKQRNDARILEEAERRTTIELQECEQQLAAIRLQAKRQLHLFSFQCVAKYHSVFRSKYEAVAKALISIDKQALLSCSDYNRQLKELVELFEQLTLRIKTDDCGAEELKIADSLCNKMDALYATINEDLEKLFKKQEQAQQEAQRKAEDQVNATALALTQGQMQAKTVEIATTENIAQEEQEEAHASNQVGSQNTNERQQQQLGNPLQPPKQALMQSDGPISYAAHPPPVNQHSSFALKFYQEIYSFYQEKVDGVKPLQSDENMKKYRFACQKAINIPLNAISAVNPQHLQDKFERIFNFLNGQPLKTAEGQISVNDHPLGRNYCLLLTAKRFVNQGETAISSNPQAAFPVASVVVSLWKLIPDFGKLFLAYIFKESPFLVPLHGKSIGEYNDLKRQAGITRLYAAVMITNGRRAEGPTHPFGIDHAWRWLVDFTNLEPMPDVSATLILEMLQTLGYVMCRTYGRQFTKLLLYIQRDYFPKLAQVDEGGPRTRLEMLFINYISQNQIPEPQGTLHPSFW